MHEKGASFKQSVTRDWINQNPEDSIWEDVITLEGRTLKVNMYMIHQWILLGETL